MRRWSLARGVALAIALWGPAALFVLYLSHVGGQGRKSLLQHWVDGTQPRGWRP
jgi:hypothetical protein